MQEVFCLLLKPIYNVESTDYSKMKEFSLLTVKNGV